MEMETQELQSYLTLSDRERKEFIAKLIVAMSMMPHCYIIAQSIVELAEKYGVYKNVTFKNK